MFFKIQSAPLKSVCKMLKVWKILHRVLFSLQVAFRVLQTWLVTKLGEREDDDDMLKLRMAAVALV
jgi:hypothetical protein